LTEKWQREQEYRLIKELWAFSEQRIAVRFAYEWRDHSGQWYRAYGNENWEFDAHGLMAIATPASTTWPLQKPTGYFTGRKADGRTITLAIRAGAVIAHPGFLPWQAS
jgi:nuclear transport factor 2 (NTF2) superfamily protein